MQILALHGIMVFPDFCIPFGYLCTYSRDLAALISNVVLRLVDQNAPK